jgi:2-keto-4-pentenoate hydratase/2-oxohepta-3-ene-1,7-dioic acid hydratase in catechol pathway
VIGKPARYVPADQAEDHVFGYTIMLDICDRRGRPPGGFNSGTDWFAIASAVGVDALPGTPGNGTKGMRSRSPTCRSELSLS